MVNEKGQFKQPAEWDRHEAVWLAWPSHENLWKEDLVSAQEEFIEFCEAIADVDRATGEVRGEKLNVLVPDLKAAAAAETALGHLPLRLHHVPFGDIWLRDTAPIFLRNDQGDRACARFGFNSWGGKYNLPHDPEVAERIAALSGLKTFTYPWILEGGSVEVDGEGTCLTSRQCLLNINRNPLMEQNAIESALKGALGLEKVLWLSQGLQNDHTDGHIDTLARFVAPGTVLCMEAREAQDPNLDVLNSIAAELEKMTDAKGRKLKVGKIPSPGRVVNEDGEVMPASYLNFYIANSTVIMPLYGSVWDREALEAITPWFPHRRVVGVSAKAILTGGGAFHCISQQQPW